jgi:exodeoxyribonuclease VIII
MRDSLMAHPAARQLIEMQGVVEEATFFIEPTTGAPCKIKPDKKVPSEGIIIDLKSTDDASSEGFAKSCAKFRYHVQDPFYRNGLNEAAGRIQYTDFFFIAVEKHPPYRVAVYQLDKAAKALGTQLYQENCETYVWCRDNNKWPAYSPYIETLGLPGWVYSKR